jgi:hypothetical protein
MMRALVLGVLLIVLAGLPSFADPAPTAVSSRSKAKREAKAKAKLEKIKTLINAGKYKAAPRRLRRLIPGLHRHRGCAASPYHSWHAWGLTGVLPSLERTCLDVVRESLGLMYDGAGRWPVGYVLNA